MEPAPVPPPAATTSPPSKIRLMCSYGGHIVPRPMDKTLCYAGGETRIVAVDRKNAFSLSSLAGNLSKSLLNGRTFTLKYQLPNHDLDSLISVSSDEDLVNMIEEYDRLSASASRLRFFLFPDLHDPTPENWFIDALKNVGVVTKADSGGGSGSVVDSGTSVPESISLEKNSSFGSTSSSTSVANSPAIKGGGEEGVGIRVQEFKASLPLIDSISSDSSFTSQMLSPQNIVYHDASGFNESKPVPANLLEPESNASMPVQASGYMLSKPMDQHQQQFIHPTPQTHYVTQYYPTPMPVPSYHPAMYQNYVPTHQPVQYQMNSPYGYRVYMVPVGQPHNPQGGPPQVLSNPVMVASPMYYDGYKSATPTPEYTTVYRTPISDDHPSQPQIPTNPIMVFDEHKPSAQPPESVAKVYKTSDNLLTDDHHHHQVIHSAPPVNSTYVGEFEDPMHAQIYKTQPTGATLSQLQTTGNATKVMLSETFAQLRVDNTTKN